MYEQHFGLSKKPFGMSPDPEFLFLTAAHREALVGLIYAVLNRKGFAVLIGEAGTGKTTLLRQVLEAVPAQTSFILNPALTPAEFLELSLLDFGIQDIPASKSRRLVKLQELLLHWRRKKRVPVLIVDEAHRLSPQVLEEIRLLTNFETADEKLLQIVLAGQNELGELLNRQDLRQLKQRIAVRLTIKALEPQEVEQYMQHRWAKAGATTELPFRREAIERIAACSQGIPRVINSVCDNALLLAYGEGVSSVGSPHIVEVARDLDLVGSPPASPPAAENGYTKLPLVPEGPSSKGQKLPSLSPDEEAWEPIPLHILERYLPEEANRSFLRRWAGKLGLLH